MTDTPLMPLLPYFRSRFGADTPRTQAYTAAAEGTVPTVRVGHLYYVPVRKADMALGIGQDAPAFSIAAE
jgi:hypothetical protein